MTASPGATEAAAHADFSHIRYAQCWEDADVLLEALDLRPGQTCLSIASAGDNSFSLLSRDPARVIAVDLNPAQLACVHLRKAAYAWLDHDQFLELIGSRPCADRAQLYQKCRPLLPPEAREFWDDRPQDIECGIGAAGKFENYFRLFRTRVMPWIHSRARIERLLAGGTEQQRREFYDRVWNTRRWRLLFRVFFSRPVMGRLGRDPTFFRYVEGSVSDRIFARAQHALRELDPAQNPYLQWILAGRHTRALPHALRPDNFQAIRRNLDRLEVRHCSIEQFLAEYPETRIDRFNLSDIFEYMSPQSHHRMLEAIVRCSRPGARLAYWNMLAPRRRPEEMRDRLVALDDLADRLHQQDRAFFYSAFRLEQVQ